MTSIQPVLERQGKHNYLPVVVGILLLFVAVGIGYLVVTSATTTKVDLRNPLAVNPELKSVALYEDIMSASSQAENPELLSFQRYVALQSEKAERNVFAENSEVTTVQPHIAADPQFAEDWLLWMNPELMAFQHYLAVRSEPRNELAVNPELSCYYRYINR